MKKYLLVALATLVGSCLFAQTPTTDDTKSINEVVQASEIEWGYLNPLRGDKSPAAGKLWGDRTDTLASGFLVKFNKGFSSPPHIHNVTYRGVVINGLLHNDDPQAENMWLPAGSFWVQPAGEAHITSADGEENVAYIEIQEGPYLVKPTTEAFDNGERPVNVDEGNLVWLNAADIAWVSQPETESGTNGAEVAFLWGSHSEGELSGTLLKIPAGFIGEIHNLSPNFRAVMIQGAIEHQVEGEEEVSVLEPGAYFGAAENSVHQIASKEGSETIIYLRTNGKFEVVSKE